MNTKTPGRRAPALLVFLALLILASGCSSRAGPAHLPDDALRGIASWYGQPYHGRKTANGETYDMHALTAAHRTLPFQSRVRVRRTDNGRAVDVRINDRGPFVASRVIDLSRGAARKIGMLRQGTAPVRLEALHIPRSSNPRWMVLVGGFSWKWKARRFARRHRSGGVRTRIRPGWHGRRDHYHVQIMGLAGEEHARRIAARLRRGGYGAFTVRMR